MKAADAFVVADPEAAIAGCAQGIDPGPGSLFIRFWLPPGETDPVEFKESFGSADPQVTILGLC
ncbi:hypothetical protein SDC9_187898 [bioreactor metagenome]|uniref:Uncharacterized protein n=1 Tax=bioreactor metagenome TaxID=1076179 RepID=A0A645HPH0_9ZZZZ